jgi:hypothetical protein
VAVDFRRSRSRAELGEPLGGEIEQLHLAPRCAAGGGGQDLVDARVEGADGIQSGGARDDQAQFGIEPGPVLDGGYRDAITDASLRRLR